MQKLVDEMRELGQKQASLMRDKARARAMSRKEEYLGARVPRELKEAVIAQANKLGIPVSILIRNILEEAFNLKEENINQNRGADSDSTTRNEQQFPGVIAWEDIKLNRAMTCKACGITIERGCTATLGFSSPGEDHVILCRKCK